MDITFKSIQELDLEQVKDIYDYYILHSTATFHTEPITEDQLKEFIPIGHERYPSYLIYLGTAIAGYCYLSAFKNRQAYQRTAEITVYLKDGHLRKGIGKAALNLLEQKAKDCGIKNLIATIAGDNTASIKLFDHMGYVPCAHFKNIGEKFGQILDVVILQKEI